MKLRILIVIAISLLVFGGALTACETAYPTALSDIVAYHDNMDSDAENELVI